MSFAGVSIVANGKLQPSAASATIYSSTASGSGCHYHLLVVEGYSRAKDTPNGTSIKCRPFRVGGYRWALCFYPNGDRLESTDCISVYLTLDQDVAQPVKVHFEFSFIDQVDKQEPACLRAIQTRDFSSSNPSWGYNTFMKRDALEQSKHLHDDCFTIRCDFIIADTTAPFIGVPMSDICQHFNHLLQTKVGADVTFEVSGETFTAHRCVLAARSTVFMAELFGPMKEGTTTSVIQIKDMEAKVFKALLSFIYTDSLPKMEKDNTEDKGEVEEEGQEEEAIEDVMLLQQLLVAADRYDLQRLKLICEEQLSKHIGMSSVTTTLALAEQHHCRGLKEACLEFLKVQSFTTLQEVMATKGWEHITMPHPTVLNELIAKLASKV